MVSENPYKGDLEDGRHIVLRYPNGWDGHGWISSDENTLTVDGAIGLLLEAGDEIIVDHRSRRIHGISIRFEMGDPDRPGLSTKSFADLTLYPAVE